MHNFFLMHNPQAQNFKSVCTTFPTSSALSSCNFEVAQPILSLQTMYASGFGGPSSEDGACSDVHGRAQTKKSKKNSERNIKISKNLNAPSTFSCECGSVFSMHKKPSCFGGKSRGFKAQKLVVSNKI